MSLAPPLRVSEWLNTASPITLEALRGKVVVIHAFQMLCPGCVSYSLPQAAAIHEAFGKNGVAVLGLHTVFEHHEAMTPAALKAFVHEYRLRFPIGIDLAASGSPIPQTMAAYQLQGTPSHIYIDRRGRVRLQHFGSLNDLVAGALIGQLLAEQDEADAVPASSDGTSDADSSCTAEACSVDGRQTHC